MHQTHNGPKTRSGPKTTGTTLHNASQYDIHTRILGLGINSSNSRMIIETAKVRAGDTVLDVGCGSGNLTLTAKKYVGPSGSVYGIDAAPGMIAVAREKAQRNKLQAIFEVGLIEQLPFPDAMFNIVISRLVIHHLPDELKPRGFAEIFRVLRPGGRIFMADFRPPNNPILAHIAAMLVGHQMMMRSNIENIPPMLVEAGFVDVTSGPTRSTFLAFVAGQKSSID